MKTLDKKQIPQFAALCVLSAGLFGYLVVKVVMPSTVAAGTLSVSAPIVRPDATKTANASLDAAHAAGTKAAEAGGAGAEGAPGSTETTTDGLDAPPPSPGMRDPFAIGYVEPKASPTAPAAPVVPPVPSLGKQIASLKGIAPAPISFPNAPALPANLSGFPLHTGPNSDSNSGPSVPGLPTGPAVPPLPSAPPPPAWTVTGVLTDSTEKIAVLRNGEARRIVRAGDFVDSTYRVVAVSRTGVVLRHGIASYRLPLGGPKDTAKKPSATGAAAQPTTAPATAEPTTPVPTTTELTMAQPTAAASATTALTTTQTESAPTSISGLPNQSLTNQSLTNQSLTNQSLTNQSLTNQSLTNQSTTEAHH